MLKLELKCNFFSNFTRLNFFVTPLGNTVKLKMQKWIQFLQKTPTLWGMKFFLFNFFQDHNFPLFVASSQESQMSSMEWQELQNVYFVSLYSGATNSASTSKWTIGCLPRWSCNIRMWHFERKSNTRNQMEKKGKTIIPICNKVVWPQ